MATAGALLQHEFTKIYSKHALFKEDLYACISCILKELGLNPRFLPCHLLGMLEREVYVEYQKYKDTQFGGWIYKYMSPEQSSILINNNNPPTRMLFVLYHELIHWFFHPPEKEYCDYFHIKSTNIIEYQANEGAAEMLVPHKVFIPWVASYLKNRELSFEEIMEIKRFATDEFHVSPAIIYYRLESLKYEIQQYVNGVDIDALEYLSNRRLAERNIRVQSLNDREWLLRRGYVA